jgi:hypothetical protein
MACYYDHTNHGDANMKTEYTITKFDNGLVEVSWGRQATYYIISDGKVYLDDGIMVNSESVDNAILRVYDTGAPEIVVVGHDDPDTLDGLPTAADVYRTSARGF